MALFTQNKRVDKIISSFKKSLYQVNDAKMHPVELKAYNINLCQLVIVSATEQVISMQERCASVHNTIYECRYKQADKL